MVLEIFPLPKIEDVSGAANAAAKMPVGEVIGSVNLRRTAHVMCLL